MFYIIPWYNHTNVTGIAIDLESCFGKLSKEILSLAYYLVLEDEIVTNNRVADHEKLYKKYFDIHETERKITYSFKKDAIKKAEKN